jgi:hypothetical protein
MLRGQEQNNETTLYLKYKGRVKKSAFSFKLSISYVIEADASFYGVFTDKI